MQGQQSARAVAVTWYERGQSDIDTFSFGWPGLQDFAFNILIYLLLLHPMAILDTQSN